MFGKKKCTEGCCNQTPMDRLYQEKFEMAKQIFWENANPVPPNKRAAVAWELADRFYDELAKRVNKSK